MVPDPQALVLGIGGEAVHLHGTPKSMPANPSGMRHKMNRMSEGGPNRLGQAIRAAQGSGARLTGEVKDITQLVDLEVSHSKGQACCAEHWQLLQMAHRWIAGRLLQLQRTGMAWHGVIGL